MFNILLKNIKIVTYFLFDSIAILSCPKREIKSDCVLLVRLDHLGDFILWLPYAQILVQKYLLGKRAILFCSSVFADLAKITGVFDEVVSIDRIRFQRNLLYRLSVLRKVGRYTYDMAIEPTYSRAYLLGDSLIRASQAKIRVGSIGDFSNIDLREKSVSDKWYTELVAAVNTPLMELERNREFLVGLGILECTLRAPILPILNIDMGRHNLPERYFVIFPGASMAWKCWPPEYYGELADFIFHKTGWTPVLCGSDADRMLSDQVRRHMNEVPLDLVAKTSVLEMVEVIRGAQYLVGNDSAAIHIAAATGTESACFVGGGHFGRFIPYSSKIPGLKPTPIYKEMKCFGCNWTCTQYYVEGESMPCLRQTTIADAKLILARRLQYPEKPTEKF